MASFGAFLTYLFFSFPQEEEKMKQMNTFNISDFINKCTNYIYICNSYTMGKSTLPDIYTQARG